MTRTRWEGLVFMLVAAGYLWEIGRIPTFYEVPGVPGPSAFPRLLGVVFGLTGLWLLISPGLRASTIKPAANEPDSSGQPRKSSWNWHFYAIWAVILGYLVLWPVLGFPVATFLLLVIFFYLMDEKRWPVLIGLSLVTTALIYVIFAKGLNVKLGLGLIASLLK